MKHFKLVLTFILLGTLVTSLAFGAVGTKKKSLQRVDLLDVQEGQNVTAMLPAGKIATTSAAVAKTAAPIPTPAMALGINAPLSGTYTIGAAGDFTTLQGACNALNIAGVSGPVVMEFIDATISVDLTVAPATLGVISGVSATNTVTFQPKAGVGVTVEFSAATYYGKGLSFDGAKYVILDGINSGGSSLTFQWASGSAFPVDDPNGATIYIYGNTAGTSNLTIKNMTIKGITDNTTWDDVTDLRHGILINNLVAGVSNVTIDKNTIINAYSGIYSYNAAASTTPSNITISNNMLGNEFGGYLAEGILINRGDAFNVHHNQIKGLKYTLNILTYYTSFPSPSGWYYVYPIICASLDGASVVSSNAVYDYFISSDDEGFVTYHFRVTGRSASSRPLVVNNTASTVYTDGDLSISLWGIRAQNDKVYNNSIYITDPLATYVGSSGILIDMGGSDVKNNIFYSDAIGVSAYYQGAAGSTVDYNGIDAPGFNILAHRAATGNNMHGSQGNPYYLDLKDLTIDLTKYSVAEDIGTPLAAVTNDKIGTVRSLTAPDAGAYEFDGPNVTFEDVAMVSIPLPTPSGIPQGLLSDVTAAIVNNRPTSATIDLNVKIKDGLSTVYDKNVTSITLAAFKESTVVFPQWTPTSGNLHTVVATITGDDETPNNVITRSQPILPTIPFGTGYQSTFETPTEQLGWVGTGDWVLSKTFTKVGGPYNGPGTYSWVTESPVNAATYTENLMSELLSPYFNMNTLSGDLYVSFYHSLWVEPAWDRSLFQYTIDTGRTWITAGVLNDPNGINWYNEGVYQFAAGDTTYACFPSGGCISNPIFLPIVGGLKHVNPAWTSNGHPEGADVPTGPVGYVFVALKIPTSAGLAGKPMVRFRYLSWSDFGSFQGWGFDNFKLGTSLPSFAGVINGNVWFDKDGDQINDGLPNEPVEVGDTVHLAYFGVPIDTTITNGSGNYTFTNLLPGAYQLSVVKPNSGFSIPVRGYNIVEHDGIGTFVANFGTYVGKIMGFKFEDINDSKSYNLGETKLAGYTITIHKDSLTGEFMQSIVTDVNGEYTAFIGPGTFVISEGISAAIERQTLPVAGTYTVTISGNSGDPLLSISSGNNFGNFKYGIMTHEVTVDRNGNGFRENADYVPLSSGTSMIYDIFKNGGKIGTDTLGDQNSLKFFRTLDVGTYYIKRKTSVPTGWIETVHSDSIAFVISTSSYNDTINFLYFKLLTVSGVKFDDVNGNGVKDGTEPGLLGWTINLDGEGGGTQVTGTGGTYNFTGVGRDLHNVTEVAQTGWVATSGPFSFTAASGDINANNKVYDFGNFKKVCISGVKFRDRNGNGVKDPGEEGLPNWNINMTGQATVLTGPNGEFSFCNIGFGSYTLTEVAQSGWTLTVPVSGSYVITTNSGVDVNLIFGNIKAGDDAMYRTFTHEQLASALKKNKTPKVGKTIENPPNMVNLFEQLMLEGAAPIVGLENITDPVSNKTKPYLMPKKYGDIVKTFFNKSQPHTANMKGFDVDNKGKLMLKLWKSMPSQKANNILMAQLLTLQVNLWASQLGHTSIGLGNLMYTWPGILNSKTIDEIADFGNEIMTTWAYVPKADYDSLYAGVKRINEVFSNTVVNDTVLGWFPLITAKPYSKSTWTTYKKVSDVQFLKANPGVAPRVRPTVEPEQLPVAYELGQNYPNPFNPTTTVEFSLPVDAFVTLKVFNLLGQEVATLINHEAFFSGTQEVDFDASQLASGVYLYRIVAESISDDNIATGEVFTQVKKMVLMK